MQEHGEIRIETLGRVVCISYVGAVNEVTVQNNQALFRAHALGLADAPWACFSDISRWELGTPEALGGIREVRLWSIAHGLRHQAVLATTGVVSRIHRKHYHEDMPENFELRYFDDRAPALAWLKELGYIDD